jgi:hypothetical protein
LVRLEPGCMVFVACMLLGTWLTARFETARDVPGEEQPLDHPRQA